MSGNDAALSAADRRLLQALKRRRRCAKATAGVQQAIREGANVNAVRADTTPLMKACRHGYDQIIRILLDAGADARWKNSYGSSMISIACFNGHLSTVQLLFNHDHDNGLLEFTDDGGKTALFAAVSQRHSDIVRFLLDSGADPHHLDFFSCTTLMHACACQLDNLAIVRLLLAAGVDVEARDRRQQTALHHAVSSSRIEPMLELILQHNANMFAVNNQGCTPFDKARINLIYANAVNPLLEEYGNKLTQEHGRLALHELLKVSEYSFVEDHGLLPPLNPLRIILPLGKLTLKHLRTLLHNVNPELIRNRDDTGKLPIHIACQTNAPVEILALILELNPTRFALPTPLAHCRFTCCVVLLLQQPNTPACDFWWSKVGPVLWPLAIDKDFCHCMSCADPRILRYEPPNI